MLRDRRLLPLFSLSLEIGTNVIKKSALIFIAFSLSMGIEAQSGWQGVPWGSTNFEIIEILPGKVKKLKSIKAWGISGEMYSTLHIPEYIINEKEFTVYFLMSSATGKLVKVNVYRSESPDSYPSIGLFEHLENSLSIKYGAAKSQ